MENLYCGMSPQEIEKFKAQHLREFNTYLYGYELVPYPPVRKITELEGKQWKLARNYTGKPVGIETWEPYPYVVDGDFKTVTKMKDGKELSIINGQADFQSITGIKRELSADEQEFAQKKFVELLQAEQANMLEQRTRAREIMEGDND